MFTEALAGLQNGESARRMDLGGACDRMKKRPALCWRHVNREFMKRVVMREKAWPVDRILQNTLDEIRHGSLPVMQDRYKNYHAADNVLKAAGLPGSAAVGMEEPTEEQPLVPPHASARER